MLSCGSRVWISLDYHWARGATGRISQPPDRVQQLSKTPWNGCSRVVKGPHGVVLNFWVEFDTPQLDEDGDGPYHAADIDARFLVRQDD